MWGAVLFRFAPQNGPPRLWFLKGNSNCRSRERIVVAEHSSVLKMAGEEARHFQATVRNSTTRAKIGMPYTPTSVLNESIPVILSRPNSAFSPHGIMLEDFVWELSFRFGKEAEPWQRDM